MLKILQARLHWYVNHELPDVQDEFRKGRGIRDQISSTHWIMEKTREFHKNIYFSFLCYTKAFDCVDHSKRWKILKEMGIPDHLTCLLRNRYAGQEAAVRIEHGTTDWFQIGKGVRQGCILSPSLFNLYAEHIMRNAGWMNHKLESRLPGDISTTSDTTKGAHMHTAWKESYDKPGRHTEKQRHLPDKGPHSLSCGFSSSHVQTWQLDHKEG